MASVVLFVSLLLIIALVVIKGKFRIKNDYKIWVDLITVILLLTGAISIIFPFTQSYGYYLFENIDSEYWGYLGSFLAAFLLAATLIYQIRSSRRQQVEAKFFELIKYYRDNISEMRIRNPFYYRTGSLFHNRCYEEEFVEGRRVMKIIFDQYKVAYGICKQNNIINSSNYEMILKKSRYKNHFTPKKPKNSNTICEEQKRRFIENEIAYLITFWGVSRGSSDELSEKLLSQFDIPLKGGSVGVDIIDYIKKIPAAYECGPNSKRISVILNSFLKTKVISNSTIVNINNSGFIKFFGGHQYQLGHYYRHLFQAVKFIDEQSIWFFSKNEKYEYVKTLRAQMSNYEQALLFINSLTIMGRKWEYSSNGRCLISEYNLIKNLPKKFIPKMEPQDYYPDVQFEWKG
ncbi:putative phage abortive infection protein [Marinifilum flexuosum]|uniref:putative phage abortive infection protein n=1 Tax=Marinifilum flexuosum TaxID=1117708 RepID=UPI002493605B|nr:putative phage abortive infection protein [Marinifilum flexuosum]